MCNAVYNFGSQAIGIGVISSAAGNVGSRMVYNSFYNSSASFGQQLGYVFNPQAMMTDMVLGGATAGVMHGISTLASSLGNKSAGSTGNVHGNSLKSTKPQHGYEIYDITNKGDVVKTGISGQPLNLNGTSPRANTQVNFFNRNAGYTQYAARVVKTDIPGRAAALEWERANALRLYSAGNTMSRHVKPGPPFK